MTEALTAETLHDELFTDPANIGYAVAIEAGDENALFDMLNQVREGGAYLVDRDPVTVSQIFSVITPEDFVGLTTTQLAQLQTVFTLPTVNLAVENVRDNLANIFGTNSTTQQGVLAL